jgi:hypothetical protein
MLVGLGVAASESPSGKRETPGFAQAIKMMHDSSMSSTAPILIASSLNSAQ